MLNIGLLGCGRIGQVHAQTIRQMDDVRITAVSDAFPESAHALAERCGAQVMETDAVINSADVDAVIIATPTDTHFDLIHTAAQAGKAIFCEKPVDMSSDRIRQCIDVVEKTGVLFLTAFNRRFDPNFATLQTRIRDGEIGQVELLSITSRDPSPPPIDYVKRSGGIFRDMMIHDFDMARFLLGEEFVQVFAVGSNLIDPEIGAAGDVDTAVVTLTTSSGAICQINNSRRSVYGYDQRVEVHGAAGMLRAGNILENTVEIATGSGFSSAPTRHFFLERYEAAYRAEMVHFVDAISGKGTMSPGVHDGLAAQLLADAAAESLSTGLPVAVA